MRRWDYPFVFQEVVRHHDDKEFKRHRSVAIFVTRFSNMVTNSIGYDFFSCEENVLWDEKIAKALKITRAGQNELEASLVETIERIKRSCFTEFHHR